MNTTLRSQDLSCPSCIAKIESNLKKMDGVQDATVHFNSGRIEIEHDDSAAPVETLQEKIRELGYETTESPL